MEEKKNLIVYTNYAELYTVFQQAKKTWILFPFQQEIGTGISTVK